MAMHPKRKQRLMIVLTVVIGVSVATALILMALKENLNAFYTPMNIAEGKVPLNRTIRMGGLVKVGSVQREEGKLRVEFTLTDKSDLVAVVYDGILPDLFREGQGIIAIGKLTREDESYLVVADEVLAKHDENYMSPELKDALEAAGHVENKDGEEPSAYY